MITAELLSARTSATDTFWQSFRSAVPVGPAGYDVVAFGDSAEMATALAGLVVAGTKRATAGLFGDGGTLPVVGQYGVMVDGDGRPRCVLRTTEVRVGPLSSVDHGFAYDEGEGEGDRTRAFWLAEHRRFFASVAAKDGFAMHDAIATVFERFTVVWPAEVADPPRLS